MMQNKFFTNPELSKKAVEKIKKSADALGRAPAIMEVCGTHTVAIAKSGVKALLGDAVKLISGPGCPVCVSAQEDIDAVGELALLPNTIIATYGDMLKVPGRSGSLDDIRAKGADVRVVYSALDAVGLAKDNADKNVIFIGVGFETTAPTIASAVLSAHKAGADNFFVYSLIKLVPPALRAMLNDSENKIDGFIMPGHVSAVIGLAPYEFTAKEYKKPSAVAGFEPLEIFYAVSEIMDMVLEGRAEVKNCYPRVVHSEGNPLACKVMDSVFKPCSAVWRSIGAIENSGLCFRKEFEKFDAIKKFGIKIKETKEPDGCICGKILTGKASPADCALFGKKCTPAKPVGPCMVSSEGACAAKYYYG